MRVLQINSVCGVGSTGRIAVDLHKVLLDAGHQDVIAYGRGVAPQDIEAIKIGTALDNYIHVFNTRVFDRHGFSSEKSTEELVKKIIEYNPDIIHLHNIHGYYLNIKVLFEFLRGFERPVIWTLHDCWTFTGHCAYFDYVGCERWKKGCYSCPQKNSYPSSLLIDNSKNNYIDKEKLFTNINNVTIVTPSFWLADVVKESFLKNYKVKVINNGIDLGVFKPTFNEFRKKNNLQNKFVILGVANVWEKRKGLEIFLELQEKLDDNYRIILVGLSEKQKSKLPEEIIGITRTSNVQELAALYTMADVYLNPTLEDNFPTTNLEALSCGTPVITFNTGGSPESIDYQCGRVVESNTINELLIKLKEVEEDQLSMSIAALKRAKEKYSKLDRYKEYVELYHEVEEELC